MNVGLLAAAQVEALAAIDWYEAQEPGLGQEFSLEILETLDRIRESPRAWPVLEGDVRRFNPIPSAQLPTSPASGSQSPAIAPKSS